MSAFVIPQIRPDVPSRAHTYPLLSSSLPNIKSSTTSSSSNNLSPNTLSPQQQQASKRRRRDTFVERLLKDPILQTMADIGKQEGTIKPLPAPQRARSRTINFNEFQNHHYYGGNGLYGHFHSSQHAIQSKI